MIGGLPEADQNHAEIKSWHLQINEVVDAYELTTAERDEAEVAKLTAQRKREQEIAEAGQPKLLKHNSQPSNLALKPDGVHGHQLISATLLVRAGQQLICEAIANGLREISGVEIREGKRVSNMA